MFIKEATTIKEHLVDELNVRVTNPAIGSAKHNVLIEIDREILYMECFEVPKACSALRKKAPPPMRTRLTMAF